MADTTLLAGASGCCDAALRRPLRPCRLPPAPEQRLDGLWFFGR